MSTGTRETGAPAPRTGEHRAGEVATSPTGRSVSSDRAAAPSAPEPASAVPGWDELLDQIAYVGDELEMLGAVLPRLPDGLHTARALDGDDSLRTALARLAARDTARAAALGAPASDAPASDGLPVEPAVDADAAEATPTPELLARATAARAHYLDAATRLGAPEARRWAASVHAAVLDDAALWKRLAEQFYDARGVR